MRACKAKWKTNKNTFYLNFFIYFWTHCNTYIVDRRMLTVANFKLWYFELMLNLKMQRIPENKSAFLSFFRWKERITPKQNNVHSFNLNMNGQTAASFVTLSAFDRCDFIAHLFYFRYLINFIVSDKCNLWFDRLFFAFENFLINTMNSYRFVPAFWTNILQWNEMCWLISTSL